jgi:predicted lipoprotein with Yx(FWY)xxD motif
VLTALALAGWGVRAAGTPQNNAASNRSIPVAAAPQANGANAANNGQAADQNGAPADQNGAAADQNGGAAAAAPAAGTTTVTTKLIAKTLPRMGRVVTTAEGAVLYRFDKDTPKQPSACEGKCSQVWPTLTTADGQVPQLEGVDAALVTMTKRADGVMQVTLGNWNLYTYLGDQDKKAGSWSGQGVGNAWWVSDPAGKKNLTCVPTSPPVAAVPPTDAGADSGTGGGANTGGGTY